MRLGWDIPYTRAIFKVHGLTLLLQVRTLWQCSDCLLFKVSPLASDALLTMFHLLLKNMMQTIDHLEMSCFRAPFSCLEKPKNHMGARSELNSVFSLEKVDQWNLH
jgi:hypothetical protein